MITRRQFIGGASALGASALVAPSLHATSTEEPLIRFGVASDVHILADWRDANCRDLDRQPEYLEKALRWFDSQRADAVVFSEIERWEKQGTGIHTDIRYIFRSTHTNKVLFERYCKLYLSFKGINLLRELIVFLLLG